MRFTVDITLQKNVAIQLKPEWENLAADDLLNWLTGAAEMPDWVFSVDSVDPYRERRSGGSGYVEIKTVL